VSTFVPNRTVIELPRCPPSDAAEAFRHHKSGFNKFNTFLYLCIRCSSLAVTIMENVGFFLGGTLYFIPTEDFSCPVHCGDQLARSCNVLSPSMLVRTSGDRFSSYHKPLEHPMKYPFSLPAFIARAALFLTLEIHRL